MLSLDFLRRLTATVLLGLMMAPMGAFAQDDNRAAPPSAAGKGAAGAHGQGAKGAGRSLVEGKSITVDHAMRTSIPEPGRDNAFSMTVNQYGISATLQTLASAAGAAILEKGGNAIDAAIAANAAVGVIEPSMNGVGGDLFMIYWDNKAKKLYALNASGWSPAGWTPETFKAKNVTRLTRHLVGDGAGSGGGMGGDAQAFRQAVAG